uniref:ATP synthase F0 subunit 8 n=1 Tax=Sophonia linealis TaxID=2038641 RepID=A0A343K7Z6_9HEMI|nr:ATP synthase F0 subunit 8 [Sophonia linealis]
MPQMSPLWWLTLMLMFILSMMMMNSIIYFYLDSNNYEKVKIFNKQFSWKW